MKRPFLTALSLLTLTCSTAFASIPQDSPEIDIDANTAAARFFIQDVDDANFTLSPLASRPNLIPCDGTISSDYGIRRLGRKRRARFRMHTGLDIAAPIGTPIVAPADGVVAFVGRKGAYGLTVMLDHGGELSTLFGHNSSVLVEEGQKVRRGQEISRVGSSGRSTGPHVHYEVRASGSPINPNRFF